MSDPKYQNDVEVLMTLHDRDIFPSPLDGSTVVWKDRLVGKTVLFDSQGCIALIGNKVNSFFLLPGGGIEDDESLLDGVWRECREETGCEIKVLEALGITEDFRIRDSKHCISHGYVALVVSHGPRQPTQDEADIGAYVTWVSFEEAIALFVSQVEKVKAGEVSFYNTCFNILRDMLFIEHARSFVPKMNKL